MPHKEWFIKLREVAEPEATLICFHYGGGNSGVFRTWKDRLPAAVNVVAVELPGRGMRFGEPLINRLEAVVAALMDQFSSELRTLTWNRPYFFFGHSIGALIAYEFTKALQEAGKQLPDRLIVSGRRAPHLRQNREPIHALSKEKFIQALREYGGTPEVVLQHEELLEVFLPILRSDFAISETYQYRDTGPLSCGLSVFGGTTDPLVEPDRLDAWTGHAHGECHVRVFDGGHFFIRDNEAQVLDEICRLITESLVEDCDPAAGLAYIPT